MWGVLLSQLVCCSGVGLSWQSDSHTAVKMNLQATGGQDGDRMERVVAVGASVFGRPVWPQVYNAFIQAADRATWVRERLAEVDYDPVGVPEGGPAARFVRDVMAGEEEVWRSYAIPDAQCDNVLAMLTLLHVPVRCVVESVDGDDDIAAEVSAVSDACAQLSEQSCSELVELCRTSGGGLRRRSWNCLPEWNVPRISTVIQRMR